MTGGVDVWAAAAAFDRSGVAAGEASARTERKEVLARFPLEEWASLPLERYALGLSASDESGSAMTYCRLKEFVTPNLGSISGGSAAKHVMYRHHSGEWRLAASLRGTDPQDAWNELRRQFVCAFEAVTDGDFEALDDLDVLRSGSALVTKSLAVYFPEHFLPVYSAAHLRRFLPLLGGTAEVGSPAWRSNRRLLELIRSRPEFDGWTGLEVMRFLYQGFDPRPRQRSIWKIAPGERGRFWDECREGGFICVGWDELEDLGQYQNDTELKEALDRQWPGSSGGTVATPGSRQSVPRAVGRRSPDAS